MALAQTPVQDASARLLGVLGEYERVVIVMHDNPDPDAIASGWGLKVLIDETLSIPTRVIGGGAVVRAENSHMVDLLRPPIELVDDFQSDDDTATVLVDCGVDATNHFLTRRNITPVGIIDHHNNGGDHSEVAFVDIRVDVAASATIVASYLREQDVEPGAKLATAMLYAIGTETCAFESHYSSLDRSILPWLTESGDPELQAEIKNAPIARSYFADMLLAIQKTFLYEDAALCFLPRAKGAEIVGEVADLLIRCDVVRRVLCGAVIDGDMLVSARTRLKSDDAAELIRVTMDGLGGAGGHSHRAGGKISDVGESASTIEQLCGQLRERWLDACGITRRRGTRLIAKRDIIEHLD